MVLGSVPTTTLVIDALLAVDVIEERADQVHVGLEYGAGDRCRPHRGQHVVLLGRPVVGPVECTLEDLGLLRPRHIDLEFRGDEFGVLAQINSVTDKEITTRSATFTFCFIFLVPRFPFIMV